MDQIDDNLDYTSYGEFVDEMIELIKEANKHFYQDLLEYYFKLLVLPCNTSNARKSIFEVFKQYRQLSKSEIRVFLKIKELFGNSYEHIEKVDEIISEIDRHYDYIYQYYERVLNTFVDLIDTHDPSRFILPKKEYDSDYYQELVLRLDKVKN